MGKALMDGTPVVLTSGVLMKSDTVPEVICEEGKEREALETLEQMGLIKLTRPVRGDVGKLHTAYEEIGYTGMAARRLLEGENNEEA